MPIGQSTNPILQQIEGGIQAKVPQQFRGALQQLVLAGAKVMYGGADRAKVIAILQRGGDPAVNIAHAIVGLVAMLKSQSKGMPPQIIVPASIILLCEGMDLASRMGKLQITPEEVSKGVQELLGLLMQAMGVNPQKVVAAAGKAQFAQSGQSPGLLAGAAPAQAQAPTAPAAPAGSLASGATAPGGA